MFSLELSIILKKTVTHAQGFSTTTPPPDFALDSYYTMSSKYTGTVVQLSFDIDTGGFSAIDTGGFSAQQLARHRGISTAS